MTSNVRDLYPGNGRRPAVSITLHRATGPTGLPANRTFNGDNPWADADAQLRFWALTAPRDGRHDRVDVIVDYGDDVNHRGTLDLTFADTTGVAWAQRLEYGPDIAEESAKDADHHHEAEQKRRERETQAKGRT